MNLGTPDEPSTEAVRRYLREFLMDPRVLDVAWPIRWAIVHATILPKRPAISAQAYRKIWTERGSPLLFHLEDVCVAIQRTLGTDWVVAPGMRYGSPSIAAGLAKLKNSGASEVTVLPLYPQYSLAASESSLEKVAREARRLALTVKYGGAFYDAPEFIGSFARNLGQMLAGFKADHVLFSFHGLPEHQVKKTGTNCLQNAACCERVTGANRNCYRAQSFATAQLIAAKLDLPPSKWSVSFQSRLGRAPWIKPYTDFVLPELAKKGVRKLAVVCPAFVADCLETLEEIQIRERERFLSAGGEELRLVPSLNSADHWVQGLARIIERIE